MVLRLKSDSPLIMAHGKFHFSFDLMPGQSVALVGPNGIGKSTFLHFLKTRFRSDYPLLLPGFLEQFPLSPLGEVSGRDLLEMLSEEFPDRILYRPWRDYALLKELKWREKIDRPICQLSGGENQVLKILAHFFLRTDVHFLDEPSNHLDDRKKEVLVRTMVECLAGPLSSASQASSMLVIDHDLSFLRQTCTGIVPILKKGDGEWEASTFHRMEEISDALWKQWISS